MCLSLGLEQKYRLFLDLSCWWLSCTDWIRYFLPFCRYWSRVFVSHTILRSPTPIFKEKSIIWTTYQVKAEDSSASQVPPLLLVQSVDLVMKWTQLPPCISPVTDLLGGWFENMTPLRLWITLPRPLSMPKLVLAAWTNLVDLFLTLNHSYD